MSSFEKWIGFGKEMGLTGKDLMEFVTKKEKEDQDREKEKQEREREERRLEREKTREHELAMKKVESDEKEREREARERAAEREREARELEAERVRKHELELKKIEAEKNKSASAAGVDEARAPKLQNFVDGKDQVDSFLHRFERFAENGKWDKKVWASRLSALLTGRALDVY
jgi:hypothetical protein